MLLKHYFIGKIAHSSYILAGKESCAVIDPRRDIDQYIDEARALARADHYLRAMPAFLGFAVGHFITAGLIWGSLGAALGGAFLQWGVWFG